MGKGQRILLIEDSQAQALEVKLNLEEKGFAVEIARNGQAGIDRALKGKFDLILLDYYLPEYEGLEIVGFLKSQRIQTPVVVITASPNAHVAEIMKRAGVADYIVKKENYAANLHLTVKTVLESR
jgi:CheY-like chemotaxis protein